MFLEKKLERWIQAELITEAQGKSILNFEHSGSKSNVMYGILAIGALSIVIGIISIIAANWNSISDSVKLATTFTWMLFLGLGIYTNKRGEQTQEVLIFLFFGSIIAALALIGQIYHLESHPFRSFSFWLVVGTPIIFYSKSRALAHIWSLVIVAWILMGLDFLFEDIGSFEVIRALGFFPLTLIYIYLFLRIFAPRKTTLIKVFSKYVILVFCGVVMIVGSVKWAEDIERTRRLMQSFSILGLSLPVAIYLYKKIDWESGLIFILSMGFLELPSMFDHGDISIIGALYFLFIWSVFAYLGVKHHVRSIFEISCIVISVRIIIVYFEVFGSLLETGLGLIVSGLFILFVAYIWHSRREKIWRMKS